MPVASLNHPNICTLHDFGPVMLMSDGVKVLDFGLAKSSSQPGLTNETRTNDRRQVALPIRSRPLSTSRVKIDGQT